MIGRTAGKVPIVTSQVSQMFVSHYDITSKASSRAVTRELVKSSYSVQNLILSHKEIVVKPQCPDGWFLLRFSNISMKLCYVILRTRSCVIAYPIKHKDFIHRRILILLHSYYNALYTQIKWKRKKKLPRDWLSEIINWYSVNIIWSPVQTRLFIRVPRESGWAGKQAIGSNLQCMNSQPILWHHMRAASVTLVPTFHTHENP